MVTFPELFTASVATSPKLFSTFMHSERFNSVSAASASARPLFVITLLAAAFAAFIALGAMATKWKGDKKAIGKGAGLGP